MEQSLEGKKGARGKVELLAKIFIIFLKIGAFTFGGGFAMIPLIRREVVASQKWLKSEEFVDLIAIAQSVPGAIAVNTAAYIGYKVAGFSGFLVAVLGAVIPSFIVILAITMFFLRIQHLQVVRSFFNGAAFAIIALIVNAAFIVGRVAIIGVKTLILTLALLIGSLAWKVHPFLIIAIAAVIGLIFLRKERGRE